MSDESVPQLLLVDDRQENLLALEAILRESGCRLLTATSGEEALRIALREKLEVILLDAVMPGMDGFEVARHLKSLERTRHLPILFLTGLATDVHAIYRAYDVGAVDFLVKPLDPVVVKRKVEVFVDLARQREQVVRMAELKLAAAEAQRTAHLQEQFLAIVAHDLRNPLGSIRMGAGLLAKTAKTVMPAAVEKTAQRILRASDRMDRLISDLLDVALIQEGRLAVERGAVDADALLHECVELFRPLAAEKNIHLEGVGEPGLLLHADHDRVLQILSNVVGNALKFTPAQGAVSLRVSRSGGQALFTISDSGRGMTDEELKRVWGRGWQAQKKPEGGLGLGLFITKGLVEAHGGDIWVESEPGDGSTFFFTMPLLAGASDEARDEGAVTHA